MGVFRLDERNFCPHAALISDPINTQDLRMTYHFKRGEGSVEKRLREIAASQIDKAIAEIDDPDIDTKETVHQVRKRAKKLRGLIRLVRPAFDDYKFENASFRDAASDLSYVRDAEANVETYDDLMTFHEDTIGAADFAPIRNGLVERRAEISCSKGLDEKLAAFRETMAAARARAADWCLDEKGYEAIAGGLGKTYKRTRKAMRRADEEPTPERLHQWRKRVKYHWYHARLLREIWPEMMEAHVAAADTLSDLLGDHHDLAVLRETLLADPRAFAQEPELEAFIGLIAARQAVLEQEAFMLGRRLLAEKTSALVARWKAYWSDAMREDGLPEKALAA